MKHCNNGRGKAQVQHSLSQVRNAVGKKYTNKYTSCRHDGDQVIELRINRESFAQTCPSFPFTCPVISSGMLPNTYFSTVLMYHLTSFMSLFTLSFYCLLSQR